MNTTETITKYATDPVLRTLVRALIEIGHLVPVLCRYDEGRAVGNNAVRTSPSARARHPALTRMLSATAGAAL